MTTTTKRKPRAAMKPLRLVERPRIAAISIEGVKAYDRRVDVGSMTALLGPVGSGKSSITDALRFAALGTIPHLGGREQDTARVMRGDRMHVRVELTDGRWFARSLGRDRDGSLRGEARCSWVPGSANASAHGAAIRGLFGASDREAAECLDLRVFLRGSAAERVARCEELLAATAATPEETRLAAAALTYARLSGLDAERLPEDPTEAYEAGVALGKVLGKPLRAAVAGALDAASREIVAGGAVRAAAWANERKNEATRRSRQKASTRAELEQRAMSLRAPAETVAALTARRADVDMRLAALRAGAAAAEAAERTRDEAQRAERAAAQAVLRHDELRESIASATEDAARWRGDAEELRDPPEVEPPAIGGPAVAAAERAERAAAERERKVEAVLGEKPAPPERPTLVAVPEPGAWARVAQIADALAVRVRGEDTAELVRELGDLAESEGGMKRAKAAAAANAKATKAYDAAVAVSDKWAARLKAAQEAAQEARRAATDARQKQLAASAGKAEAYENAVARRAAVVDANAQKRKRLLAQAADAEGSVKGWQQQIDAEAAAHREAIARLAGVDAVAPATPHAAGDIEALEQEQAQIDRLREDVEGSDARRREMEVLVAEIEATEAEGKVYAAVEWALGRLRERDVANRGAPLLDTMRAFLRHAGREEEPYLRATKAATEFGWRTKAGAEVALEALSGGETVLFTTALAAAVVSLRAPELRVLIVEAAELGSNGAQHAAMLGLTAVELDNALLATCAPVDPPAGWNAVYFAAGGGQPITGRTVR